MLGLLAATKTLFKRNNESFYMKRCPTFGHG
jgi:hypothetical protein